MRTYKLWTDEELKTLEELCKESSNWKELYEKSRNTFKDRSWNSIRFKARENSEWLEHFGKGKITDQTTVSEITDDDDLGFSPEELEIKLERLKQILQKGATTVTAISEDPAIDVPKEDIWPLIDKLRKRGHNIVEGKGKEKRKIYLEKEPISGMIPSLPPITKRERIEVLFMSDLCLGLKSQQGDLVATCLEIGEQREVFFNLVAGNLVVGKPIKGKENEYFLKTAEEQAEYVISHFPKTSFNTFLLKGSRELSFEKGKNGVPIESLICQDRDDIRYLGDKRVVIPIGRAGTKIAVVSIESQAYTKSYPLQGVMENFQEAVHYVFEHSEPIQAIIAGGLHSGILIPRQFPISKGRYNDFDGVALPGLHRITPSQTVQRRRGGSPVLGCLVLGTNFGEKGKFKGFTYAFYDLTAYFKDDDYLAEIEIDETLTNEAKKILLRLKKKPARYGELANTIRKSIPHVKQALDELKTKGYDNIWFNEARKAFELKRELKEKFKPLDLGKLFKTTVKFALTADWHVGHKGDRLDLIPKVFQIAEERKVDAILNCGNSFEGTDAYSGQARELCCDGADSQRRRLFEVLPKSEIPMVMISASGREHERIYWTRCGHDIVDTFAEIAQLHGYKIEYLGGAHGIFKFEDLMFDLQHPKGGLPYGQTYRPQRRIEMLASAMDLIMGAKATFMGHLHRAAFLLYKGIAGVLVPSLEDTTEYITAMDKLAELGMWIVELAFDENKNLTKAELEYIPFEPKAENINFLDLDELMKKWSLDKSKG